jgi:hypothetical protein
MRTEVGSPLMGMSRYRGHSVYEIFTSQLHFTTYLLNIK